MVGNDLENGHGDGEKWVCFRVLGPNKILDLGWGKAK